MIDLTDLQVVAAAKNKFGEIQGVVSGAANGAVDCVQHTVTWVMSRIPQADGANRSLVQRAIGVTALGLDSALTLSEALMDRALPPTKEDKGTWHITKILFCDFSRSR